MDWRHKAACREVDPELFFPIGNSGPALLQIDEAKQVCRRCTVMDECLRWAIDSGQDAGVWGGMSEDERRALKRRTIRLRARAHVLPARVPLTTPATGRPGALLGSDREIDDGLGAAAGLGRDPQPTAQFADHQRADDLQAKAGGRVQVEAIRQAYAVVRYGHGQPVGFAHRDDLEHATFSRGVIPGRGREAVLQRVLQ
jgi:WhiB family transcriptional regulator, redox-sensing transcriptional regulator